MKNMTLENIAKACGGQYIGSPADKSKEINGVTIDSRIVEQGDLFIAIKGARADGHDFIPDVMAKGALAVLSEKYLENPQGPYIKVERTEEAMQKIAAFYRRTLDIKVVGITGSVGKTSTKEMIASVLSQKYNVLKTEKNHNNEIGLPLTIFKIREEHEIAVLEMGISDFGEMHRLAEMAHPDICVITNIGLCHLENLKDRDGILKAKTECFAHMTERGTAVLNADDDKLSEIKEVNKRPVIFYGIENEPDAPKRDAYATDIRADGLIETRAVIHIGEVQVPVLIPIAGRHNVYNALAAACVGREFGLSAEQIQGGIAAVEVIEGRSKRIEKAGMTIIDDCYNANPVSMMASLDVLAGAEGRKIAVLGDMGELGEEERLLHALVGEYFAGKNMDALFCAGVLSKELADAAKRAGSRAQIFYCEKKEELIKKLQNYKKSGDTILVKASHFMEFPEIVKALTE